MHEDCYSEGPTAMVNLKALLRAVLPVVTEKPPVLQNQPAFVASNDFSHLPNYIKVATATEYDRRRKREQRERACPQQGGERISEVWLRTLPDRVSRWHFKSVLVSMIHSATHRHHRMTANEIFDITVKVSRRGIQNFVDGGCGDRFARHGVLFRRCELKS